jgi:hypothetical protein
MTTEAHPAWCDPQHCYRTDDGVRVHHQAPIRWGAECVTPVQFETSLLDPDDADTTYLELRIHDLVLRDQFSGILPLDTVRRLRDQLTEHLDTAETTGGAR